MFIFYRYIETAWIFSTVLGIFLFLIEIGLICWIQFYDCYKAQLSITILLVPIVLIFLLFALKFYKNMVSHTYSGFKNEIDDLQSQVQVFRGDDATLGV